MGLAVFSAHCVLNVSCSFFSKHLKQGTPSYFIRDTQSNKDQSSLSTTQSDGSRGKSTRRSFHPGGTNGEDESKGSKPPIIKLPKSSNQEEIMALLRRIRSSISKDESANTNKSDAHSLEKVTSTKRKDKILPQKRGVAMKNKNARVQRQHPVADFRSAQPPSNFERRSPIASLTPPRAKVAPMKSEAPEATANSKVQVLQRAKEMKLTELKELAKARGIRGYSKMKKAELVELLST